MSLTLQRMTCSEKESIGKSIASGLRYWFLGWNFFWRDRFCDDEVKKSGLASRSQKLEVAAEVNRALPTSRLHLTWPLYQCRIRSSIPCCTAWQNAIPPSPLLKVSFDKFWACCKPLTHFWARICFKYVEERDKVHKWRQCAGERVRAQYFKTRQFVLTAFEGVRPSNKTQFPPRSVPR